MLARLLVRIRQPSRRLRLVAWALLVSTSLAGGMCGVSPLWIVLPIVAVLAVQVSVPRTRVEPVDVWIIELDGEDVGRLVDGSFSDMFWRDYTVTGDDPRLFDTELWERGRFGFRNAASGRRVVAFCGGQRPMRESPHVTMRGLG